ncbi:MAG TPA: Sec-independent protein translocase protein TatB [Rickettsiales bacterium]|nr:Sec-independent protein translocase protein TatB [Rickettsiales bacterium]
MLDFSFGELALVGLVALVVVGPKDLPVVMRAVGRWFGQFKGIADEFREGFRSAMQEGSFSDIKEDFHSMHEDLHEEVRYIKDDAGNFQRVYDISDIKRERMKEIAHSRPEAVPHELREEEE